MAAFIPAALSTGFSIVNSIQQDRRQRRDDAQRLQQQQARQQQQQQRRLLQQRESQAREAERQRVNALKDRIATRQLERERRRALARMRARMGAAGVGADGRSGSAAAVLRGISRTAEQEIADIHALRGPHVAGAAPRLQLRREGAAPSQPPGRRIPRI